MSERTATIQRQTSETDITLSLNIDGTGVSSIDTGIGFFDHMLTSFTKHGFFDLTLNCKGDLIVDGHHTIEDCGIALGSAIKEALGKKEGIKRFGDCILPMDDALVLCALDISGRPFLSIDANLSNERVGYMETDMVREFFYAISYTSGMNLHLRQLAGENDHHIIEAMFKAFAKALDAACTIDPRISGQLSAKGSLS